MSRIAHIEGRITLSDDDDESSEEELDHVEEERDITVQPLPYLELDKNKKKSKYLVDEEEELEVFRSVDNTAANTPADVSSNEKIKFKSDIVNTTTTTNSNANQKTKPPNQKSVTNPKGNTKASPLSLIDAMAMGIADEFPDSPESSKSKSKPVEKVIKLKTSPKKPTLPINAPANAPAQEEADIFGISYKPFGKKNKKKDYDMPTGPAFDDENEFEKELKKSEFHVSKPDSLATNQFDEEFDFEGDDDNNNTNQADEVDATNTNLSRKPSSRSNSIEDSNNAVMKALQRAAERVKEQEQEELAAILHKPELPAIITLEELSPSISTGKDESLQSAAESESAPIDIRKVARAAMAEITEIYSSGLGDQEVRLLNSNQSSNCIPTNKTSQDGSATTPLDDNEDEEQRRPYGIESIAEGDEEAEVQQDEVEEVKKKTETLRRVQERQELEDQWKDLDSAPLPASGGGGTEGGKGGSGNSSFLSKDFIRISYNNAESYFKSADLSSYISQVIVEEPVSNKWSLLGGPTKMKFDGFEEKRLFPFLIAQVDYDPSNNQHFNILQTIFKALAGSVRTCPVVGPHWEQIGFQGTDPRTDINRSMKMLAALQMLHLVEFEGNFARRLYTLANSQATSSAVIGSGPGRRPIDMSWPLFCVSIQFTREALQVLRNGLLNKECNARKAVLPVLHDLHKSLFVEFVRKLTESPAIHHAEHLAAIRKICASDPLSLIKSMKKQNLSETVPIQQHFDDVKEVAEWVEPISDSGMNGSRITGKASKFLEKP